MSSHSRGQVDACAWTGAAGGHRLMALLLAAMPAHAQTGAVAAKTAPASRSSSPARAKEQSRFRRLPLTRFELNVGRKWPGRSYPLADCAGIRLGP